MRFIECKKPRNKYAATKNLELLKGFIDADIECAVVEYAEDEYTSPYTCTASLRSTIKRYRLGIDVVTVDRKVYLMRRYEA